MKALFVSLPLLLLAGVSANAQLNSTPLEPGLKDYLMVHSGARVATVGDRAIVVSGITAELIKPDQITISAVIADLRKLTPAAQSQVERMIGEYNVSGAVGTLANAAGTLRLVHHFNPGMATPMQISDAIDLFRQTVDEQRRSFEQSIAMR